MTHDCALLWFRRDLRLTDNPALQAALESARTVIPVYIHDDDSLDAWSTGAASRWWLHHSLAALAADLAARGSALVILQGDALSQLNALSERTGATAVLWNRLYEPAAIARDRAIKSALRAQGIDVQSFQANLWHEPALIRTATGDPYRVFTPFWRRLSTQLPLPSPIPAPAQIPSPTQRPTGEPLAALGLLPRIGWDQGFYAHWTPGEAGALHRLRTFADTALADYHQGRDYPDRSSVSRLSPHLHFGELSPRQIHAAVLTEQAESPHLATDAEHFLRELGWREFAHHLLFHFPYSPDAPLHARFADFPWRQGDAAEADLHAWQQGRTGIPIVDAGMRELWTTGWMHNRVRMIVASVLTKNLLIPWQAGARWFWDTLVDADLASNTLGWQWVAGCGADAAPYFRIFNPALQSQRFDAEGHYIARWVPELTALPAAQRHAPPTAQAQKRGYPAPIVDLRASRERALAAYAALRQIAVPA
ncbi:deoxyribodipyrimidine photo-lyase [Sinimarinibacterium sp. CAU 1509]|uniref:cryptochrome/photolyase family protein n=1 Tax=Sinimarinibacterium sp. CAU 1509 TaxID=2562283 RepID=UPI0010ACD25B|nr:deoxyribodipyrimidine photo-lyase [Sinimarinibacterium sp. CAU 1509]TJY65143.1 deoxyribodipyrimidine photo-lyase [Sinimarinibacterium sp. CAU 1509]